MKQTVQTDFGTFVLTVEDDLHIDMDTRQQTIIGKRIAVGGKYRCITINVPAKEDRGKLNNVKVQDGGCELYDKQIRGADTVKLMNLAFTVVRKYAPHIKYLVLEDNSKFTCTMPDGSTVGISLALYELLFYEQTWYERHIGAELVNNQLRTDYESAKENFGEPISSGLYTFNNESLNSHLIPLKNESVTYRDFFQKISKMKNKCEVIFPWYTDFMYAIFNDISFEIQKWQVNLHNPKMQDIPYKVVSTGGRRRYNTTRKSYMRTTRRNRCGGGEETIRELWPEEIYNLKIVPQY